MITVDELISAVQEDSEQWRIMFAMFQASEVPPEEKAIVAGFAAAALLRKDNPRDYPWAVDLFKQCLEFEDRRFLSELVTFKAALIRLLALTDQRAEALERLGALKAITETGTRGEISSAKKHLRDLRREFHWLR